MKPERRGALLILGVLILSAVLGGLYGPSVRATAVGASDMQDSIRNFTRVLAVVQQDYAIPVDTDKAFTMAPFPACCVCSIRTPRFSIRASTRCCVKISAANITASA